MEEVVEFYKNDTVRSIERVIAGVKAWRDGGGLANPRETALVITKLEEARMWALQMVRRNEI
jgi:hypothetical protein